MTALSRIPSEPSSKIWERAENAVSLATRRVVMQFEIRDAAGGQYYWRIVAANDQVLATSETYWNKADAQSAAASVKQNAAGAPIYDYTHSAARR
jgi:uncharacterized protein YegP (UPF0339 family)